MKFSYLVIYRHSDKNVLINLPKSSLTMALRQELKSEFLQISKQFKSSQIYENMREINSDFNEGNDDFPWEDELGGKPIWYSTCDKNLIIYSVMCPAGAIAHSSEAYQFLRDIQGIIKRQFPDFRQDFPSVTPSTFQSKLSKPLLILLDNDGERNSSEIDVNFEI